MINFFKKLFYKDKRKPENITGSCMLTVIYTTLENNTETSFTMLIPKSEVEMQIEKFKRAGKNQNVEIKTFTKEA